jgi:chromate transport protein ChrA
LPGPNIVNMSIAIGSRFHGVAGAWLAVAGLMLAPLVIVLSMAVLYDHYQSLPDVQGTLHGLASTAAGLLLAMVLRMGEKIEHHAQALLTALLTFIAVGVLRWPLLPVLLVLGPISIWLAYRRQQQGEDHADPAVLAGQFFPVLPDGSGGAITLIPEMHYYVVESHHWMTGQEFAALFAIAQAAPGPNVLVVSLIGWKVAGLAGALVATVGMCGPSSCCVITWRGCGSAFTLHPGGGPSSAGWHR